MTADSQWVLQQAVYAALRADSTLQALTGATPARVFDHVPQDSDFPYVVIGEATTADWDTKTEDGMNQTLMIHSWSRHRGLKEVKLMMAAVVDALDRQALSTTGHTLVQLRFEFSDTFLDQDGLTRHGVQRLRALTESS